MNNNNFPDVNSSFINNPIIPINRDSNNLSLRNIYQPGHDGYKTYIKPNSFKYKKKPTKIITTGVDTEYIQNPNHPNTMITTQVAFSNNDCVVLEHPSLKKSILPTWNTECILSTLLGYDEVEASKIDGYLIWEVLMFFAPADLLAGLFKDFELCRRIQQYCQQDARIRLDTGKKSYSNLLELDLYLELPDGVYQLVLKVVDFGKVAQGGLAKTITALGGNMMNKDSMDEYKSNMLEPYTNPDLLDRYLKYAKDDAQQLFFLREANNKRNQKLFEIHNLPFPPSEIVTVGSLVAKLFEAYLDIYIGDYKAYKYFTQTDLRKTKNFQLLDLLKYSTVAYFAKQRNSRKQANALVQGGRAKNERPNVIYTEGVIADTDLSSCYVSILRKLVYPVGLPCTYGQHESSTRKINLGQFLKKHGDELEDRLFIITVSGKLNHHQTLVPSKVIDSLEINEKYSEDDPKIPADFRLYTQEIINGIITFDILDVLKNVCNTQERKQWMELEVVSAVWYPKSLRCNSPQEWYEKTKNHVNKKGNEVKTETNSQGREVTQDNRSKYWLAVPIEDFLNPYANIRSELKSQMKQHSKDSSEYRKLDAQQKAMKLVGNTLYGVLASPYFDIGNVVVANCVTAAARVGVWCTAMATGSYQSITDGGAYNLNAVRDWTGRKPSMNVLSLWRNKKLIHREYRSKLIEKPLGDPDSQWYIEAVENDLEQSRIYDSRDREFIGKEGTWVYFDQELLNHVRHFFRGDHPIDILNHIKFEHKDIYTEIVIHGQTNYRFRHASGEYKLKARGHKLQGTPYNNNSEKSHIVDLFEHLKNNPQAIPPYAPQTISQILKCNQANEMLTAKTDNIYQQNKLLAGDTIEKCSWLRPISLSMFHWKTHQQYQDWVRKADSLKQRTGWGIEQFYLNEDGTVNYEKAISEIQAMIDENIDISHQTASTLRTKDLPHHPYHI